MPEVAGRLTECKRLVSLHKLTKSLEAYFWEIKNSDEIYQSQNYSEAKLRCTRYRKLHWNHQWQGHKLRAFHNFQLVPIISLDT